MRIRTFAAATAFAAALAAQPAAGQSLARQLDLLRLEEQAGAIVGGLVESEFAACPARLPEMKAIMADPRLDRVRLQVRRAFLFAVIVCSEVKERPLGLEAARRLEPIADSPEEVVAVATIQLSDALDRNAMAEATRRFLRLLDARPEVVAQWRPGMVGAFTDYIDEDPDLALTALRRIVDFDWRDPESRQARDNEWALALGQQLGDRGRAAEAAAAVAKADQAAVLLYVAGDRRFETGWAAAEAAGRFDWRGLVEGRVKRNLAALGDTPATLRQARELVGDLRALGRYDEAIQIGEAFRARIQDGETFADAGEHADWVLVQLAHSLLDKGEAAAAETVFREAIASAEGGGRSADARMNWAGRLLDLGRPKDVLAVLDEIDADYVTPYGKAWIDSQRACALVEVDPKRAETLIEALRRQKTENPAALSQALLCANRIDEAAALLAWRLQTPRHRGGALDPYWISRPPPVVQPWLAEFERRRQAMLDAPAARKALDAVGRPVTTNLAGGYWGGF